MVKNKGSIEIVNLIKTALVSLSLLLTSNVFKVDNKNSDVLGVRLADVGCGGKDCGGTTVYPKPIPTTNIGPANNPVPPPPPPPPIFSGVRADTPTPPDPAPDKSSESKYLQSLRYCRADKYCPCGCTPTAGGGYCGDYSCAQGQAVVNPKYEFGSYCSAQHNSCACGCSPTPGGGYCTVCLEKTNEVSPSDIIKENSESDVETAITTKLAETEARTEADDVISGICKDVIGTCNKKTLDDTLEKAKEKSVSYQPSIIELANAKFFGLNPLLQNRPTIPQAGFNVNNNPSNTDIFLSDLERNINVGDKDKYNRTYNANIGVNINTINTQNISPQVDVTSGATINNIPSQYREYAAIRLSEMQTPAPTPTVTSSYQDLYSSASVYNTDPYRNPQTTSALATSLRQINDIAPAPINNIPNPYQGATTPVQSQLQTPSTNISPQVDVTSGATINKTNISYNADGSVNNSFTIPTNATGSQKLKEDFIQLLIGSNQYQQISAFVQSQLQTPSTNASVYNTTDIYRNTSRNLNTSADSYRNQQTTSALTTSLRQINDIAPAPINNIPSQYQEYAAIRLSEMQTPVPTPVYNSLNQPSGVGTVTGGLKLAPTTTPPQIKTLSELNRIDAVPSAPTPINNIPSQYQEYAAIRLSEMKYPQNIPIDQSQTRVSPNPNISIDPNTGKPRIVADNVDEYFISLKNYCSNPNNNCSVPELLPSHLDTTIKYLERNSVNGEYIPEGTPIPGGAVTAQSVNTSLLRSLDTDSRFSNYVMLDAKQQYLVPIPVKVEKSVVDPARTFVTAITDLNYYAKISSGFRSETYQAVLYQNRVTSDTAKPGYSQHQTGLAIDVKSNMAPEDLRKEANKAGFIEPFYKPQYGSDGGHFYCLECKYPGLIKTMEKNGYSTALINDIGTLNGVLEKMGEPPIPFYVSNKPKNVVKELDNGELLFSNNVKPLPEDNYYPDKITPTMIIIHTDGTGGLPDLKYWNTDQTYGFLEDQGYSAQFGVGLDGKVVQFLPMYYDKVQKSIGSAGRNDKAINIELSGKNLEDYIESGKVDAELNATADLVISLMNQYNIPLDDIFPHSDQDTILIIDGKPKNDKYILKTDKGESIPCTKGTENCWDKAKDRPPVDYLKDLINDKLNEKL